MPSILLIALGALVLASVHVFAGRMRFLDRIPRSRWLSIASGSSVAYVFLHLLPELTEAQRSLEPVTRELLGPAEHEAYFIAALGLTVFYGFERLVVQRGDLAERGGFMVHTGAFAIYNLQIGYLLAEQVSAPREYVAFVTALALHFLVNDYGLRKHHEERYHDIGRWVLGGAVLIGGSIGAMIRLPEPLVLGALAFVAGGIVLNVLKEELPEERESRFWPFAAGMAGFSAFLSLT